MLSPLQMCAVTLSNGPCWGVGRKIPLVAKYSPKRVVVRAVIMCFVGDVSHVDRDMKNALHLAEASEQGKGGSIWYWQWIGSARRLTEGG
jgi:hypothetical protein